MLKISGGMATLLLAAIPILPAGGASAQEGAAPPSLSENSASRPSENAPAPAAEPAPSAAGGTSLQSDAAPSATADGVGAPTVLSQPEQEASAAARIEEGASQLPRNLSPWGMFMAADWVVKAVMIGLVFASLVTWTVWLAKSLELAGAKLRLRGALRTILHARSLDEAVEQLGRRTGPAALFVRAAADEMHVSAPSLDHAEPSGVKERVESRLARLQVQTGRRLGMGTGVLATIGSTAPFVGLFGTVWGIMNAFIGISEAQTTNLAVVAPGIAEALLATALGLVAAIPAVVIYNVFARSIAGYRQVLGDAAAGVQRLVSRDLDRRRAPASPAVMAGQ
ncbi:tonB-system energizer ExbB [Mesorhizobium sp. PUT5]|uniref:tonB-system energizer ExbB n=1 Tax=Mesorhizobium sp. PUT5 TaxID=3454629 RepID=UPI003FA43949